MQINPERFLGDLHQLRRFGAAGVGKGVSRPAFTKPEVEARLWLADRITQADLKVEIDHAGNLFGLSDGPSLLLGSHSDSQPEGGWLDGALGVIAALEVARSAKEAGGPPISVVSFQDEEGRFGATIGSGVWTGALSLAEVDQLCDANGVTYAAARQAISKHVTGAVDPAQFTGFIEPHIEQGPWLDRSGLKVGVVTAIVGFREIEVTLTGEQNHAGTTAMAFRRDAVQGMVAILAALNEQLPGLADTRTVWTTGRIEVSPNAAPIVPGRCRFTVQWRDADDARLDAMEETILAMTRQIAADRGLGLKIAHPPNLRPSPMDAGLRQALANAAEAICPGKWQHMPSGAVHDAGYVARIMPAAMLFVPSIGGVSHDFAEDTDEADLVLGLRVLAAAAEQAATV